MQRILLTFLLALASAIAMTDEATNILDRYINAYNDRDIDAVMSTMADSIRWMAVDGDELAVRADGRTAVRESLENGFTLLPSARSRLLQTQTMGDFVSTIEEVTWNAGDGTTKTQCAMAVYQLTDGLLANVWYFAAQACPAPGA